MCGIIFIKDGKLLSGMESLMKIKQRGPNETIIVNCNEYFAGFVRLAIQGKNAESSQPMFKGDVMMLCNGEIYNYKELEKKYNLKLTTQSDCEVVLLLYLRLGFEEMIRELDGEYAIIIYDKNIYFATDEHGIRPLHYSNEGMIASEKKCFNSKSELVDPKKNYMIKDGKIIKSEKKDKKIKIKNFSSYEEGIRYYMFRAVCKRLQADNLEDIGFLLSGGLDSSIICSIASLLINYNEYDYRELTKEKIEKMIRNQKREKEIICYTIGMENSTDVCFAQELAKFINAKLEIYRPDPKTLLDHIEQTIYTIESPDTTTVRASIPHYLVSKLASKKHKIILSGEGADEICGGYIYLNNSPSVDDFISECDRLENELHHFDVRRLDRCVSAHGMEARPPFLDFEFINYYKSIPGHIRFSTPEKLILRSAFKDIIPITIYNRQKEAFSDGVSCREKSWFSILQTFCAGKNSKSYFSHLPCDTDEKKFYLSTFFSFFPNTDIPHYWMPKWSHTNDPSARTLVNYLS